MKLALSLAAAGVVLAAAAPTLAQGVDAFGPYGGKERAGQKESPQNAAFEFRFGPYRPNVDSEFSGPAPFDRTFGGDKRYMIGFELDWQALRIPGVGTLGPGFSWGYTKATADAWLADNSGRSAQKTTLTLMPMYVVGVLRVDVLARNTPVPLVPYAKLGFGYALWWAGGPDGTSTAHDGTLGKGAAWGPQYALGGMLLLDFLDRTAAVEMDSATGINNSYFFMEWYQSHLGLAGNQMHVGTNTWFLGLAFEI